MQSLLYEIEISPGLLKINGANIPLSADLATASHQPFRPGGDTLITQALDAVQQAYVREAAEKPGVPLTVTFRDSRERGLNLRKRFTSPNQRITLGELSSPSAPTALGTDATYSPVSGAAPEARQAPPQYVPPQGAYPQHFTAPPTESLAPTQDSTAGTWGSSPAVTTQALQEHAERPGTTLGGAAPATAPVEAPQAPYVPPVDAVNDVHPAAADTEAPQGVQEVAPAPAVVVARSYAEKVRAERGWAPLPPEQSDRPRLTSPDGGAAGASGSATDEKPKNRWPLIIGGLVAVLALILGLQALNGGGAFDAVCVDQRTMSRAASGVACEAGTDTNHRWWYIQDAEQLPQPGDSVQEDQGTFEAPSSGATVTKHSEAE